MVLTGHATQGATGEATGFGELTHPLAERKAAGIACELAQIQGGAMKFYPQTALQQAGGSYRSKQAPSTANVVTDRELITGQNPASATGVAHEMLKRLQ